MCDSVVWDGWGVIVFVWEGCVIVFVWVGWGV